MAKPVGLLNTFSEKAGCRSSVVLCHPPTQLPARLMCPPPDGLKPGEDVAACTPYPQPLYKKLYQILLFYELIYMFFLPLGFDYLSKLFISVYYMNRG